MERQVVLTLKTKHYNKKKIDSEIQAIREMLIYVESFKAFCDNYEVFDFNKNRIIKKRRQLLDLYNSGFEKVLLYAVSKN